MKNSKNTKTALMMVLSVFILIAIGVFPVQAGTVPVPHGKLIIFHAGSLAVPLATIEKKFEAKYPKVDVLRQPGGSTKMARMISEVGKPADIMAAADYKVIDGNLIPKFATWNIRFATNQLVLCYTNQSKFADKINKNNWYKILQKKGVEWGHGDPNVDPCGYRTLMVMQLAEKYYGIKDLYKKLIASCPKKNIRPKSEDLINLLKTGNLDYVWEYLSVAVQHRLKFVKLNDHINLGNYKFDKFYSQARVKVTGKKPGTWKIRIGRSCTYGITMIKNCANPVAAIAFLKYMLSPDGGLKVLKSMGQPPFEPCRVPTEKMMKKLPRALRSLVEVKN